MPISIQALREQKAEKLKAARELQSKETFTVDDQTAFDALLADANALESRIQGQMKLEALPIRSRPKALLVSQTKAVTLKLPPSPSTATLASSLSMCRP